MTIHCKICGHPLKSEASTDKQKTVLELMAVHIKSHPDHHREFGITLQVFASYLLSRYCEIPDTETELLAGLDQAEQNLMEIFGFEVEAPKKNADNARTHVAQSKST
jgi:hypothetical protein